MRIVYSRHYDIGFFGLERLHPFDSRKYSRAWKVLRREFGRDLAKLHVRPASPVSREELLSKVWGYARNLDIETRTVDIHVAKLRRKIETDNKAPELLITVRGAGYRLVVER